MSVTSTATLSVREETVLFLSSLPHAERVRRGIRAGQRSLTCFKQAVLVIRWFLDGTRMTQLTTGNAISLSTGYDYLDEGITVLAARAPCLESALLAEKMVGYAHINIDGTLIETDRCHIPGPAPGVDLWWSGKPRTAAATSRSSPPRAFDSCGPLNCVPAASSISVSTALTEFSPPAKPKSD